jgi:hypothetical protein
MPEPVIARRCPTCGASIREVALFCPQCGNPLPDRSSNDSPSADVTAVEEPGQKADRQGGLSSDSGEDLSDGRASASDFSETVAIPRPDTQNEIRSMSDTLAIDNSRETAVDSARPRVRGAVGAGLQRAGSMARGVEGDVKQRARKVREISSVVLDEAAYDPSLRFVLVAVVVFALFLIIVLLNKFIT